MAVLCFNTFASIMILLARTGMLALTNDNVDNVVNNASELTQSDNHTGSNISDSTATATADNSGPSDLVRLTHTDHNNGNSFSGNGGYGPGNGIDVFRIFSLHGINGNVNSQHSLSGGNSGGNVPTGPSSYHQKL